MSKSKEPKPVSEFTKEQREWFRINKKYERKLQPFFGKSMALDSPEHKKYKAIELERELELLKFNEKHCKPEPIDTPGKLGQWIELKLATLDMIKMANRGEFPFERAKESYKKAREYARKIRESNPCLLPILLPPWLSNPENGLQSMQEWCTDADLASIKTAETEQKERPLPLPSCRGIKDYVAQIETPRELLDFLKDGYKQIYDSCNFGNEPSFFDIIRECVFRIREKHLSLNLPPDPRGNDIVAYENWCIDAQRIIDATTLTKTEPVSTKQNGKTAKSPPEGEWSKPMSKSKMMNALNIDSYKTFNTWAKDKDMKPAGNRQTFTIRLDILDAKTRQKLEKA